MSIEPIIKRTNEIIAKSEHCYVASIQKDGFPHVSTRSFCTPGNVKKIYISTNTSGSLADTVEHNNKMSICVCDDNNNITMIGTSKIIHDMEVKKQMWQDWFIDHYTGGVSDPEFCVIEFTTSRLSLWVDRQIVKLSIDEIE